MTDEIEIEVLQHGGNHHENHVLSHKGKEQMCPAEVIVLYVEVLFACSTLIIECNDMINSTERSDILVFNCYICHVRFLLTCYVCSTKIGEISDISKCFENFVSQVLGALTRIYAAELR